MAETVKIGSKTFTPAELRRARFPLPDGRVLTGRELLQLHRLFGPDAKAPTPRRRKARPQSRRNSFDLAEIRRRLEDTPP